MQPLRCRLVREGRLGELTVCIVDELHMLCDPSRGVALELSITKLLHSEAARDVQVRTMGAYDPCTLILDTLIWNSMSSIFTSSCSPSQIPFRSLCTSLQMAGFSSAEATIICELDHESNAENPGPTRENITGKLHKLFKWLFQLNRIPHIGSTNSSKCHRELSASRLSLS